MTRSRLVVLSSFVAAGLALTVAAGLLYLDPARAAVGPLPAAALILPADASFVAGLDMQRFAASPLYQKYFHQGRARAPEALGQIESTTGIRPDRDVEQIVFAGSRSGGQISGVAVVVGRFELDKLAAFARGRGKGTPLKNDHGVQAYAFSDAKRGGETGVAFLDGRTLVLGPRPAVEAAMAAHATGSEGIRANAPLVGLLERVKPGSTLWMVGDETLLSQVPGVLQGGPGAGGSSGTNLSLPALRGLVVTGEVDPVLFVDVTGTAADEPAARNLADMVRGFVALATLQAGQRPELQQLASAISVTTEGTDVRLTARLPYELLDALQPKKPAAKAPQEPGGAPEPAMP